MKHVSTLPQASQLLSIRATMDIKLLNTNNQSTPVEAMVVAGQ